LGETGAVFVIHGQCPGRGFAASISATSIIPVDIGFVIEGQDSLDNFGTHDTPAHPHTRTHNTRDLRSEH
jgi:hypothetical protein